MARSESTQRSDLHPETLIARLQARGVEQLREADAIWVALDGSDLRKPHAREMGYLSPEVYEAQFTLRNDVTEVAA